METGMETFISSKTKTVIIGPDQPFTIIGERINPTGRKMLAAEMAARNYERIQNDALAQVEAGARLLDVNAGIPLVDEPAVLEDVVKLVQSIVDVPLCIDSSIVEALQRGLAAYEGKALVNSVTGEDERLETVLPLVKKHNAAVIAISNDETGISDDPDERFAIAKKIVERAMDYGIPKEDVIIDPLVMPVGAKPHAGRAVFQIIRRVREELGCNTVCGASNVSFGLPNRKGVNATFIPMLIAAGMTSAITNPLEMEIKQAILAANALMGNDENCANWIQANAEGESATRRRDRQTIRQRRQTSA
jgi:5-methyltetrahydrofolate--homocysteine methyltransferase